MISTTKLAADLVIGDKPGRKTRITNRLVRPDGRVLVKVTTKGGGSTVASYSPDEYVRVYVNA